MRAFPGVLLLILAELAVPARGAEPLAFPGATGFGAAAVGGRGGDVYIVTSLADDGPGSLRDAVATASGPRTVVFEASGIIDLQSPLVIEASHLTVAGQTASGGITIRGYPVTVLDARHVILRYLRFRLGDLHAASVPGKPGRGNADLPGDAGDALSILGCDQVMIDHVSASWGMDETLSVTRSTNVTVQYSIISESLLDSYHSEGLHGRGSLVRGSGERGYTFYRNLWAHHNRRSPALGGQQDPPAPNEPGLGLDVDLVGNVIYDWGLLPSHVLEDPYTLRINLLGNTWVAGPSGVFDFVFVQFEGTAEEVNLYRRANRADFARDAPPALRKLEAIDFNGPYTLSDRRFRFERRKPRGRSARAHFRKVLEQAGASHARDDVDARVVAQLEGRTGGLIDSQDDVGGWPASPPAAPPPADTDRDGMADAWERARGLDPTDPADRNGRRLRRRYTNLEVYLHARTH